MDMTLNGSTSGDQDIQADQYAFPYHYTPDLRRRMYLSRHWGFAGSYMAALQLVGDHLRPVAEGEGAGWRHIDIGCGDGALIYHLTHLYRFSEGQITGVDIDERAIAWARMFNPGATLHAGNMAVLEGGYHSASMIEVLEHIPATALPDFVAAAAGLLSPGGLLVVTVPSVEKPVAAKHFQHFSFESIRGVLEAEFESLQVRGFERRDALSGLVYRLRMNPWMRVDAPVLNRLTVSRLKRVHTAQTSCGRLLVTGHRRGG